MMKRRRGDAESSGQQSRKGAAFRHWLHEILEYGPLGTPAGRLVTSALIALIAVNLAVTVLETVPDLAAPYGSLFFAIELVSLIVFTAEYLLRLWIAGTRDRRVGAHPWRARIAYARSFNGIVDLISSVPFWFVLFGPIDLRALLVFRMVRFLKLARYSLGVQSLLEAIYEERRPLAGCFVVFLGTTLLASSLIYLAEREAQPDKFGTIPLAMWWAITTLGTTAYGDVVPITPIGKLIAAATVMAALVMIALPVGLVASAFSQQIHRRDFMVTWGMVARVPLFAGLSATEIASVMRLLSSQTFAAGDVIARRGEPAHSMFFIASGEVEIELQDGPKRLGVGHFFGEVAVLRRARRSATVTAVSRSRLLVLDGEDLHALMQRDPRIAERVREVTRDRLGKDLMTKSGDIVAEELESESVPRNRAQQS